MRLGRTYGISIVTLLLLGSVAIFAKAADNYDQVTVKIPNTVMVAGTALRPGEYQIRQTDDTTVQVKAVNGSVKVDAKVGKSLFTFAEPAKETKVILYRAGNNYVMDQLWIQGKPYFFEFSSNDRGFTPAVEEADKTPDKQMALSATYEPIPATTSSAKAIAPK